MRILFIASSESIHSHKWISYFTEKGHDIIWYSMTNVDSPENFAGKFFGSRTGAGFFYFLYCFCARRLVKTYQPDIVHALSRTLRPSSKFVAPSELSYNRLGST